MGPDPSPLEMDFRPRPPPASSHPRHGVTRPTKPYVHLCHSHRQVPVRPHNHAGRSQICGPPRRLRRQRLQQPSYIRDNDIPCRDVRGPTTGPRTSNGRQTLTDITACCCAAVETTQCQGPIFALETRIATPAPLLKLNFRPRPPGGWEFNFVRYL